MMKDLRQITSKMRAAHKDMHFEIEDRLCTKCRKRVAGCPSSSEEQECDPKELPGESSSLESDGSSDREIGGATPGPSGSTHELFVSPDHELSLLNQTLVVIGESPIIKRKASTSVHYVEKKARSIESSVIRKLELETGNPTAEITEQEPVNNPESEMLEQLKEKFQMSTKKSDKVQVLTVLPKS